MKFLVALLIIMTAVVGLRAGDDYTKKSHDVTIDGTSTLHDWTIVAEKVTAQADLSVEEGVLKAVYSMKFTVDVMSIKSDKSGMDDKIYGALKVEDGHKTIVYTLNTVSDLKKDGDTYSLQASGSLVVAGYRRNISMVLKATVSGNGDVTFTGTQDIKMSDYKMEKVTAMLGAIKTGEDVTVKFSITMKKKS